MMGQDEGRGFMKQVHLLERNGQRQWIVVNTFADSSRLQLTVVTLGDAPKILSAAELQKQIDSQGFATLNVNFDTNKAELREADRPTLEQVVQLLKASPALRLSIDGHTDNVGQPAANKLLSQQRAQAIVEHLVAAGIARDRLVAKGYGLEVPVGDNRSEEGRAKNRRVELVKLAPAGRAAAPEAVQPNAAAPAKASVQIVAPEALADVIKTSPQLVVLFTSPSTKCGFCIGADTAFDTTVAQMGDGSGWRYVRTEWPEWKQYPPVAQASGVLGLPDHVVFRNGSVVGHVTGRIKDLQELARKIQALQSGS
jgi:outer membrane protein OmpA-like peptidoglycan-associated protein